MLRLIAITGILLGGFLCTAAARWKPEYQSSDFAAWYAAQKDANGRSCCDRADAHDYYGDYLLNADGSVSMGLHHIRTFMVLRGPNPLGHAVWWYTETDTHELIDYCFAPGNLG